MTEPTQMNPTPVAVPWTPEMMNQMAPSPVSGPAPSQVPAPAAPLAPAPQQPNYHAAPQQFAPQQRMPQPQPMAAQPVPAQPIPAQPMPAQPVPPQMAQPQYQPQPAQPMAAPYQQPQQHTPAPQVHPHHMNQHPALQMHQQQPAPQQMGQPQIQPQPAAPRHQQGTMPPPLAPHMKPMAQAAAAQAAAATAAIAAAPAESKSLIGKLLKRSPKPVEAQQLMEAKAPSGSLFNKNFLLGAVTGLVVGAFVLPMVLNLVRPEAPAAQYQAQAAIQPVPGFDPNAPALEEGETFLDAALNSDTP